MVRCLSYLNSMSDIVCKKYKILVHTITFKIIVSNQQKLKKAGAALVITITSIKYFLEIRANLKRHNRANIISFKHTYRPMRGRVVAQLFCK